MNLKVSFWLLVTFNPPLPILSPHEGDVTLCEVPGVLLLSVLLMCCCFCQVSIRLEPRLCGTGRMNSACPCVNTHTTTTNHLKWPQQPQSDFSLPMEGASASWSLPSSFPLSITASHCPSSRHRPTSALTMSQLDHSLQESPPCLPRIIWNDLCFRAVLFAPPLKHLGSLETLVSFATFPQIPPNPS